MELGGVRGLLTSGNSTLYLGRTFTGWIAPACGWRTYSIHLIGAESSVGDHPHQIGGIKIPE